MPAGFDFHCRVAGAVFSCVGPNSSMPKSPWTRRSARGDEEPDPANVNSLVTSDPQGRCGLDTAFHLCFLVNPVAGRETGQDLTNPSASQMIVVAHPLEADRETVVQVISSAESVVVSDIAENSVEHLLPFDAFMLPRSLPVLDILLALWRFGGSWEVSPLAPFFGNCGVGIASMGAHGLTRRAPRHAPSCAGGGGSLRE